MNQETNFTKQVEEINAQLRSFGCEAVQEIKMMKDGQVIGQIRYGYKPQYVFDAVNKVILPENWRYEVVSKDIFENQVVAEVKLFLYTGEDWFCKGSQAGQMQIVRGNVGDAMKGAITDGLQKCLSLLSIGCDAYKGLLGAVYKSGNRGMSTAGEQQPPSLQTSQNQQSSQTSTDNDLPKIAGISYQQKNGIVIAVGNSFDKKELLKSAGFKWDKADKNWFKDLTVH